MVVSVHQIIFMVILCTLKFSETCPYDSKLGLTPQLKHLRLWDWLELEKGHAMRNILPWLLIELITSSNERSADSNEIICPSTTAFCTILVQQYCSTRWHLTKGVPWMWVCEKFPLEKEFCVFLKVPWYQSKLCLSYSTAHGSEVYSTSLSLWNFFFSCSWV